MTVSRARTTLGKLMLAKLAAAAVLTVAAAALFSAQLLAPRLAPSASGPVSLDRLAAATRL